MKALHNVSVVIKARCQRSPAFPNILRHLYKYLFVLVSVEVL